MPDVLKVVSVISALLGVGVLPLFWSPARKHVLQGVSFAWGLLAELFCLWIDREVIYKQPMNLVEPYTFARFITNFLVLWWSFNNFHALSLAVETLRSRYSNIPLPPKRWYILSTVMILLFLTVVFDIFLVRRMLNKNPIDIPFGLVVAGVQGRFQSTVVIVLYLSFVGELTFLFRVADYLWKKELDDVVAGKIDTNLQTFRIFHTEISSVISIFKKAFGLNLLLFFGCTFIDILIAFNSSAYGSGNHEFFIVLVALEVSLVMVMIKFTEEMVTQSESIVSNLRNLNLSALPGLEQLQVELLVQKLQHCPVTVTVCGMFTISKALIGEVAVNVIKCLYLEIRQKMKKPLPSLFQMMMGATTCCNAIVQLRPYIIIKTETSGYNISNTTQP